jgi:hypothetical protein
VDVRNSVGATVNEGVIDTNTDPKVRRLHRHTAVVAHALRQRAGIPYEVEQRVCSGCRRVLDERTVRRAAA